MSDEITSIEAVKKVSDGTVNISVEKYNNLLETIADQKGSISKLTERLNRALNEPPVINRTVINKTAEMVAQDHRAWGATFMGAGAALLAVGAIRYKLGSSQS